MRKSAERQPSECQSDIFWPSAFPQDEDRDKLPWTLIDTYSPWFWVTRVVAIVVQLLVVRWYLGWELSWFLKQ